jgi:hypothetical protein
VETSMTNIKKKISEAEDWADLSDILLDITKSDIIELKPFIPELIENKTWLIRCDVLDVIGRYELSEFIGLVKKSLHDRILHVRDYALMAYYDLLGKKALMTIRKLCKEKNVQLRITALALCYVETRNEDVLRKIRKIVTRKGCIHRHQGCVINCFEHYLNTDDYPEIIELYKDILRSIPKSRGVAKDLRERLKEIRNSRKK